MYIYMLVINVNQVGWNYKVSLVCFVSCQTTIHVYMYINNNPVDLFIAEGNMYIYNTYKVVLCLVQWMELTVW